MEFDSAEFWMGTMQGLVRASNALLRIFHNFLGWHIPRASTDVWYLLLLSSGAYVDWHSLEMQR